MAFHIIIEKVEENDFIASYRFKSGGAQFGFFQIDKRSGEVSLTKQMLGVEEFQMAFDCLLTLF